MNYQDLLLQRRRLMGKHKVNLIDLSKREVIDLQRYYGPTYQVPLVDNIDKIYDSVNSGGHWNPNQASCSIENNTLKVYSANSAYGAGIPIKVEAGATYELTFDISPPNPLLVSGLVFYDETNVRISKIEITKPRTFTIPQNITKAVLVFSASRGVTFKLTNLSFIKIS